jgi:segregation and condensation protein B
MTSTPDEPDVPPPEDLSRSYGNLLEQQTWEVDTPQATIPEKTDVATGEDPPPPYRIVEALLFLGGPPLTEVRVSEIIRGLTPEQFRQAIERLNHDYKSQGRPYAIVHQEQGYVLSLRPRFRMMAEKLSGSPREARLSAAAIDALALVAYRQPVTKAEVDSLRGAESGALLRQLVRRGLIAVVQRGDAEQRAVWYGTTPRFLELFGLANLDDLPRTQDLQQL